MDPAVLLLSFAFSISNALSAPVDSAAGNIATIDFPWFNGTITSSVLATPSVVLDAGPFLLSTEFASSQLSTSCYTFSSACLGSLATPSPALKTAIVTVTETLTASTATTLVSLSTSATVSPTTPSPAPSPSLPDPKVYWTSPANMSDLEAFNITYFPSGQDNTRVITSLPNQTDEGSLSAESAPSVNSSTVDAMVQLLYPAHSINPGSSPQGGAEFYAQPLDLSNAQNVSLEYSVFFPQDFDWVLAGKLPGIYGGHTGCSGGNDAADCFSTRLMWRERGIGELYLYAPRAQQAESLCNTAPQSLCDSTYGMSIGRGSFNFTPGAWTHVKQFVSLNTPGKQDGGFVLQVNGKQVIKNDEVFYRSSRIASGRDRGSESGKNGKDDKGSADERGDHGSPDEGSGGLLGSLLGDIRRSYSHVFAESAYDVPLVLESSTVPPNGNVEDISSQHNGSVGFSGLFFSTFFGGHDPHYATPKDQYTWFKDFAITINS